MKGKAKINFNLYLVTGRNLIHHSLIPAVKKALKGGVRAVQLREKDLGTGELLKLAKKMRDLTLKYEAKLFINDRFDIALAVDADGVHLTQNSIPPDAVRKVVGDRLLIGVSTHSLKEAKEAEKAGADFITVGPVYRTPSKLKYGGPLGVDTLKNICGKVSVPVFAIGGIKSRRIKEVKVAGAYGVAMISEVLRADDIQKKAGELLYKIRTNER